MVNGPQGLNGIIIIFLVVVVIVFYWVWLRKCVFSFCNFQFVAFFRGKVVFGNLFFLVKIQVAQAKKYKTKINYP